MMNKSKLCKNIIMILYNKLSAMLKVFCLFASIFILLSIFSYIPSILFIKRTLTQAHLHPRIGTAAGSGNIICGFLQQICGIIMDVFMIIIK